MREKFIGWRDDLLNRKDYKRFSEKETRKQRIAGQFFSITVAVAATYYISWCFFNVQWDYWYVAIPFLITEIIFILLFLLWVNILWVKRYHRPDGPLLEKKNFSVDIFISTCREPVEIIKNTIAAAVAIDYDNKKIFVLDDGDDDKVKSICKDYNVSYVRRTSHEDRKAGNLNHALKQTGGELILVIDADQVVKPEIINRIIGYFTLSKIAFVQTKQAYKTPKGDPWSNSDTLFYSAMMPGKDFDNSAFSCGTGIIYRRTALDSVGGFSTWNLVEDLHTSMLLHSKGWRTVYHNQSYTEGTTPTEIISYSKQRWQWAVDSLRIFFWDNPLFKKGLSFYQRFQYFHVGYHYVAFGIFLPIFFIIPIWALFTHNFMLQEPFWLYILARLPYFLLAVISNKIITDKLHTLKVFQAQAGLFAVYFSAFFTALFTRKKPPQYTVTKKDVRQYGILSRIFKCFPHIVLILLSFAAAIYGIVTIKNDSWFLVVNLFWAFWTIVILYRFVLLSLFPKWFVK